MFKKIFGTQSSSPLPRTNLSVAETERVYAVGDVHGRYDLLGAMLAKISDDIKTCSDDRQTRVIFLGDYIDRGDHSREVVEMLSDIFSISDRLKSETGVQFHFLAGNHEIALLNFLDDPVKGQAWLDWGGLQTLASFGIQPSKGRTTGELKDLRTELFEAVSPFLAFLRGLSPLEVSGSIVFVHAGLDPEAPLDGQPEAATLWGQAPSGKDLGLKGYRTVHGHFAGYEPVSLPDRICIDTGAYYSGRLTAVRLDAEETFLHVDTADLPLHSDPKLSSRSS